MMNPFAGSTVTQYKVDYTYAEFINCEIVGLHATYSSSMRDILACDMFYIEVCLQVTFNIAQEATYGLNYYFADFVLRTMLH